jgi:hypothetical protein
MINKELFFALLAGICIFLIFKNCTVITVKKDNENMTNLEVHSNDDLNIIYSE